MANVLHPHIDFHRRPVAHAPSPFGFGFGLGAATSTSMSPTGWGSTPGHTNPAAFQQLASSITQSASSSRPQKRRLDADDDAEPPKQSPSGRDDSMDRSPTPERVKRAPPKRARVMNAADTISKDGIHSKENKAPGNASEDEVDVGVLLATLPPQSLLPILSSLIKAQPGLKSTILTLIPRPTLETALHALTQSAKKLREAYPYQNHSATTQSPFGSTPHSNPNDALFGQPTHPSNSGMRDSYITSRLRPHVMDFVSCCMSYLPYFTCIPFAMHIPSLSSSSPQSQSATTIQSLHKDKFHPSETFLFLSAITNHILAQPQLTITQLSPFILPRLSEEWKTWVDKIDEVTKQGGMFGSEMVRNWERGLDEMTDSKAQEMSEVMRGVRDSWIAKVGWLVGRIHQQPMDEL